MHDVTIFPIFDADHHPSPRPAYLGCLNSTGAISAELPSGTFIEAVRKAQGRGEIKLGPGHYLALEFIDDQEEFGGLLFTVTESGEIKPQCLAGSVTPNITRWPPRKPGI